MLFPPSCAVCRKTGAPICSACIRDLPDPPELVAPALVERLTAVTAYEDGGAALVRSIKYGNSRGALDWVAVEIVLAVGHLGYDQVTWVPSSGKGKRHRGYEPSKLLAQRVSYLLKVPLIALLSRSTHDRGQTRQDRNHRLEGPQLITGKHEVGSRVLVIDDVSTTGASLTAAARLLREAGATVVDGAVIARTPPPDARGSVA